MKRLKQLCKDLLQVVFAYSLMSAINWDFNAGNWGWFGRIIFILLVSVLLITNDKNKQSQ